MTDTVSRQPCCNCRTQPRRTGDSYCRDCRNAYQRNTSKAKRRELQALRLKLRQGLPRTERREFAGVLRRLADMIEV